MTTDEALQVLGLEPGASAEEISIAFRELAQMLHPDKFADDRRLSERAEKQMRTILEARETLAGGASRAAASRSQPGGGRAAAPDATAPDAIRFEAEARAHAAETVRLTVVMQVRTMRERRRSMVSMVGAGLVGMLICYRFRGTVGSIAFGIASMVSLWGAVDLIHLSSQIAALDRRARDLLSARDRARDVARQAQEL